MTPWHIRGVGNQPSAAVGRIRSQDRDARHLAAETVVKDITHAALRYSADWIDADLRVALAWGRGLRNQGLAQRGIALKLCASGAIFINQRYV